ncbi:hypothetical protein E1B28_001746 [Marasmius oreades]|uniref:Uncharacterized protein n=1 Tax=Marasmius oreades TaxID=181124 RepID=A0A9P7V436_9AGAR|nr:uncharacterized protein E1B28_001746 [Marasmius oreades]KAG7099953.1 hypothetical protein E1B28_001746 [Marasmius oreades]
MPSSKYILDEYFDETSIHLYHDITHEADNDRTHVSCHYSTSQDTTLTLCDKQQSAVDILPEDLATSAKSTSEHGHDLSLNSEDGCHFASPKLKKQHLKANHKTLQGIITTSPPRSFAQKTSNDDKTFERFIKFVPVDTTSQPISLYATQRTVVFKLLIIRIQLLKISS